MWPFARAWRNGEAGILGGRVSKGPSQDDTKRIRELQLQVEQLTLQKQQLQEQLEARDIALSSTLYRFRTLALPILGSEWEERYFVLNGQVLKYYKSAQDTIYNPREDFNLMGCTVEWEGLVDSQHWTFTIRDSSGSVQLRLSALSRSLAEKWFAELLEAGCEELQVHKRSASLTISHTSPAKLRPRSASITGVYGSKQHHFNTSYEHEQRLAQTADKQAAAAASSATASSVTSCNGDSGGHATLATKGSLHQHQHQHQEPQHSHGHAKPGATEEPVESEGETAAAEGGQAEHRSPSKPAREGPMLGSSPVHTSARYSYLSSERMWHEKHTGLYNLAGVILVATNFRLALENALKYGWRFNPFKMIRLTIGNPNIPLALCYPLMLLMALLSLVVELLAYNMLTTELKMVEDLTKKDVLSAKEVQQRVWRKRQVHEWSIFLFNVANTTASMGIPWVVIHKTQAEPIAGGVLIMLAVVCWMKLVSYHHCCWDLRMARREGVLRPGERGSPDSPAAWAQQKYPENLTVKDLLYFLAAPTLTYQVNYPRSRSIRKKWLLRRIFELVIVLTALTIIISQYIEPAVHNSLVPLRKLDWPRVVERVLKLALPSTYAWLCGFYALFHVWLNVLAELLRFGDREFYKDWWNAATLGEYWKLWNMPVHKWLLRHVYFPSIRLGLSRFSAVVMVFFVSAVFHELVVGVPLHMVRFWAFAGIMLQVPMVVITEHIRKRLKRDVLGNVVFWLSFVVIGQPVAIMMYYYDFQVARLAATVPQHA